MKNKEIHFENNISGSLKLLRTRKEIKQEEIASALNITRSAYANYEQGRRTPDLDTIIKIAEFYDTSIDFIIGNEKEKVIENELIKEINTISDKGTVLAIIDELKECNASQKIEIYNYTKFIKEQKKS